MNRNAPCPCGSGKKHKKCCLQKENVIQLHKRKVDKFFDQKHELVNYITHYVWENMTPTDEREINKKFVEVAGPYVEPEIKDMLHHFYSIFMHRFPNGLRGVEGFYKKQGSRLPNDLRSLLKTWINLHFKLVEATQITEETITFQDMFTGREYSVPNTPDNVRNIKLHEGTFSLLEPFSAGQYYFHGIRVFVGHDRIIFAKNKVEQLMVEEGLTHDQVLMKYPLEIFAAINMKEAEVDAAVAPEDQPLVDELELQHFPDYSGAFIDFFKEKTIGKSDKTMVKYRDSLRDLSIMLRENQFATLGMVGDRAWWKLIGYDFFEKYERLTKTQITDMISVLKALACWLQRRDGLAIWDGLVPFLKEEEEHIVNAVQLANSFFPNRTGDVGVGFGQIAKLLSGRIIPDGRTMEGYFEITRVNKQSFRVIQIGTGEQVSVSGADVDMMSVEEGIIFSGKLAEGSRKQWEVLRLDKAYPAMAKPFLVYEKVSAEI